MKLGVVSDIHGNADAFATVMRRLRESSDRIVFLGDLVGYYPFASECVQLWDLERTIPVIGNHDAAFLECWERGTMPSEQYRRQYGSALGRTLTESPLEVADLIREWPERRSLQLGGTSVLLVHGSPWDPINGRIYPDSGCWERFLGIQEDVVLMGHTHRPLRKDLKGRILLNPGSIGQPRDRAALASFAILDTVTGESQHYRVGFETARLMEDAHRHDPDVSYLSEVLKR